MRQKKNLSLKRYCKSWLVSAIAESSHVILKGSSGFSLESKPIRVADIASIARSSEL